MPRNIAENPEIMRAFRKQMCYNVDMSTTREGTSTGGRTRSTTAAARRAKQGNPTQVWGEVTVTVAIGDNQFVKFTFGHERTAPNDDAETLDRYERLIHRRNEEVVSRRVEQYARLIKEVQT